MGERARPEPRREARPLASGMGFDLGRDVVFDPQFEQEWAEIEPEVRRAEEALRYLEWVVRHRPERGYPSDYPGVVRAPLKLPRSDGTMTRLVAFYIYDDRRVQVLSVKRAPSDTSPE